MHINRSSIHMTLKLHIRRKLSRIHYHISDNNSKAVKLIGNNEYLGNNQLCWKSNVWVSCLFFIKILERTDLKGILRRVSLQFLLLLFITEKELLSPPLDGTILPGITRKSLLELGQEWVSDFWGGIWIVMMICIYSF